MKDITPATDEEIAAIEAIYADNPRSNWDFTIEECMALIARIRKEEARVAELEEKIEDLYKDMAGPSI